MNTSPAPVLFHHAALLLALAFTTAPLLARQDAAPPADPTAARVKSNSRGGGGQVLSSTDAVIVNVTDDETAPPDGLAFTRSRGQFGQTARDLQRQAGKIRMGYHGADSSRLLIVPDAEASPERLGSLREELAIMSRLLAKAADPEGGKRGAFRFNLGGGLGFGQGADLDALYLDGYGAVFLLDVDFPLVEPAKAGEKQAEPKTDKDAAWEKARRELAGEDHGDEAEELDADLSGQSGVAFDADKVAGLRKRLTGAFRHAANLKAVKSEDQIVVQVTGRGTRPDHRKTIAYAMDPTMAKRYGLGMGMGMPSQPSTPSTATAASTLTLRAKKADVDAFAAGQLKADEFAKKVSANVRDGAPPAK